MPQCVEFVNGVLQQSAADLASCTGYLLLTPQEYSDLQSPFFVPLTLTQGFAISTAIAGVWALAWVFRTVGNSMSSFSSTQGD